MEALRSTIFSSSELNTADYLLRLETRRIIHVSWKKFKVLFILQIICSVLFQSQTNKYTSYIRFVHLIYLHGKQPKPLYFIIHFTFSTKNREFHIFFLKKKSSECLLLKIFPELRPKFILNLQTRVEALRSTIIVLWTSWEWVYYIRLQNNMIAPVKI